MRTSEYPSDTRPTTLLQAMIGRLLKRILTSHFAMLAKSGMQAFIVFASPGFSGQRHSAV